MVYCFAAHVSSGSGLSYNDYDYDYTNTNVSSHICNENICSTDLANSAKNKPTKGAVVAQANPTRNTEAMKRLNNIYNQICSFDNLHLADMKARKGKKLQPAVQAHDRRRGCNIMLLHDMLRTNTYTTSEYVTFKVYEPKEREVYRLPYFPDRIVHHAVMNLLEPVFVSMFTADTYSCIKGKGIHGASRAVRKALNDQANTKYCLKLDVKKFYPSVDHDILKVQLRRKFKDNDLLRLLDGIIDSAPGLPIGNYLSQYLANFYLTGFDHWIKEDMRVQYYFRYADDIVVLAADKPYLHQLLSDIRMYLTEQLHLTIKENYQVFPVEKRGIDFVGYRFYHTHTLLRKGIKKRFAKMLATNRTAQSIAAYKGWLAHCNSKNLTKKLLNEGV